MNKQELINELNCIKDRYRDENKFENGVKAGLSIAIEKIVKFDGYEVEKEKLYYVLDKQSKTLLMIVGDEVYSSGGYELHDGNKDMYQLTEGQIKDYDEHLWQFAVEVAE